MRTSFANRLLLLACGLFLSTSANGQTPTSYLNDAGSPPYATTVPVENGYVDLSNGNLHLEFPLASPPQRGSLKVDERLVYDSRIWMFAPFGTHGSYHWWPNNIYGASTTSGGWRLVTGAEIGSVSNTITNSSSYDCAQQYTLEWEPGGDAWYTMSFDWTDSSGTVHPFSATETYEETDCWTPASPSYSGGGATDGSGYSMSFDAYGNPTIMDSGGAEVYPTVADRYGNYLSSDSNGNVIDDTGRTPVITANSGNNTYYDVLAPNGTINNNGTRIRYTVTTAPVPVATDFRSHDQSDIYSWDSQSLLNPVNSIQLPDGSSYTFTYDGDGELSSVTLPTGGVVTYGYTNFVDSADTENRWVAYRQHGSDPAEYFTPSVVTSCTGYSTGCQEQVIHHKPNGDETAYLLTLQNGAWNTQTTIHQGSASVGPQVMQVSSSNTYSNPCAYPCSNGNYLASSLVTTELDGGAAPVYAQTQTSFNTYTGTPTVVKDWDYASSINYNAPTGAPVRETDYTYAGSPSNLTAVTVRDGSGNQVGLTSYGFTTSASAPSGTIPQQDTSNFQQVYGVAGSYLHTITHWLNTGSSPVTTITMDNTGEVVSVQDPDSTHPPTTTSYQCANSLPYQVTPPIPVTGLPKATTYTYVDCNSAALQSVQDPNDYANSRPGTQYSYESQTGRVHSITYPDGGSTTYTYPMVSATPTPLAVEVDTSIAMTSSTSLTTSSIVDSFGRPYQTNTNGVTSETTYDANGRVSCVTNPHTSSTSPTDGSTCITTYDPFDRPVTQQNPDSTTKGWWYYGNTTGSSDEGGNSIWRTSNAFGHLIQVTEFPTNGSTSGALTTTYGYDTLGDLTSINQAGNGTTDTARNRSFTYDSLARLVCASNPESTSASSPSCPASATSSIPMGVISYGYYPDSTISSKTDARGITISYSYDSLDRVLTESSSDNSVSRSFGYDNSAYSPGGIGRLAWESTGTVASGYYYDPMGRITTKDFVLPSMNNVWGFINASYDLAGDMISLTYPDGQGIQQAFNTSGQLCNVTVATGSPISCATSSVYSYFSQPTYAPMGAVSSATFGNGIAQNYSYNNRLQVGEISAANSGGMKYMDKVYCYGASACTSNAVLNNGNIVGIADALNSNRNQNFTYDGLNRLSSFWNGTNPSSPTMSQNLSIDSFGNASVTGGTLTSALSFNPKNQVSSYAYDAAGNVTQAPAPAGGTLYYNYDAAGQLSSIGPSGSPTATYTYDANGARVRKDVSGGAWTEYMYFAGLPIAEHNSSGAWSDYIYAAGQRIARIDTPTNLLPYSQQLTGSDWGIVAGAINPNSDSAPDGTQTATTLVGASWGNQGQYPAYLTASIPSPAQYSGKTLTASVWLRSPSGAALTTNFYIVQNGSSGFDAGTYQTVNLTSQWQRFTVTGTMDAGLTSLFIQFGSVFAGQTMEAWGAQVEQSSSAGPYVATGPSTETLHYYSTDHLGTTTLVTDAAGGLQNDSDYYPFGAENPISAGVENHYKFTGYERDADSGETGNDYAMARYYNSISGRFMSPDPFDGSMDIRYPQTFNRYSYVLNSPLGYTDPTGLTCTQSSKIFDSSGNLLTTVPGDCTGQSDNGEWYDPVDWPGEIASLVSGWFGHAKFRGTINPRPHAPNNFQRMPLPGNHLNCTTSTGTSFPAPPGFSVSNIAANGAANGLSGAGAAVGQGGYYDFQRFQVGSVTQFFKGYTPVANVAVGAYVQGTGAPQWMASLISNTYAFFNSNNGATAQQAQFRNLGFSLAAGKASYSCQPSIP